MAKVTVLMPTYNVAPYVCQAVESVLQQTFSDFLLLVIDDCSADDTVAIVRSIKDPRIRIVQNERNLGLAENLNRGLELTDTELVARMDGDDIALPHWLQSEVDYLDAHPNVGVCGGGFERFGSVTSLVRFPENHEDIAANMLFECTIAVPTFRMDIVREHGLRYRSEDFPAEDYGFWVEMLKFTQFHNISDTLFRYRMHPSQICSSRQEEQRAKVDTVRRKMLFRMSDELSDNDLQYFCNTFALHIIASRDDLRQRLAFANRLVSLNSKTQHIDPQSLLARLKKHLRLALYHTATSTTFSDGYSIGRYIQYLQSGLALKTGYRLESKILIKSMLHSKQ